MQNQQYLATGSTPQNPMSGGNSRKPVTMQRKMHSDEQRGDQRGMNLNKSANNPRGEAGGYTNQSYPDRSTGNSHVGHSMQNKNAPKI